MAGNVSEWTMESYDTNKKILRGGKTGGTESITSREQNITNIKSGLYGFRVAIYIK